jgi:CBS domain-containing protein/uncharacterized protein (DUF2267 family)
MQSIVSLMSQKVIVLREDTPAIQAARAMCTHRVGCVVACDRRGHVSGIVTDRDLACSVLAYALDPRTPLSEVMTAQPVTIEVGAPLEQAIRLMEGHGIRRVPVVRRSADRDRAQDRERCVGLLSVDDLIAARAIEPDRLAGIVQSQVFRPGNLLSREARKLRSTSRSEAHHEQTLGRFVNRIAAQSGISPLLADRLGREVLAAVVRRVHYRTAMHFISQLPHRLQQELLDLPAGPDRGVGVESLVRGVGSALGVDRAGAAAIVAAIWSAIVSVLGHGVAEHVFSQLPEDFRRVLSGAGYSRSAA